MFEFPPCPKPLTTFKWMTICPDYLLHLNKQHFTLIIYSSIHHLAHFRYLQIILPFDASINKSFRAGNRSVFILQLKFTVMSDRLLNCSMMWDTHVRRWSNLAMTSCTFEVLKQEVCEVMILGLTKCFLKAISPESASKQLMLMKLNHFKFVSAVKLYKI